MDDINSYLTSIKSIKECEEIINNVERSFFDDYKNQKIDFNFLDENFFNERKNDLIFYEVEKLNRKSNHQMKYCFYIWDNYIFYRKVNK